MKSNKKIVLTTADGWSESFEPDATLYTVDRDGPDHVNDGYRVVAIKAADANPAETAYSRRLECERNLRAWLEL